MFLTPRRRTARVAAGVAALSVLAACGGSDPRAETAPPAAPAATGAPTPSATPSATTPSATTAADPATDRGLARFYKQKLTWRPCGLEQECTQVTVPIDWAKPEGKSIELAVTRVPGRGSNPTGSLLVNPGGPGGRGTTYASAVADRLAAEVRARYDVVGFDPRGVADSAPIDCLTDRQLDRALSVDPTPDDAADLAEVVAQAKALAEGCKRRSGELLAHVDTESVARDVDLLRGVLGDEKLNWLGSSYGTYIGSTYAQLFPTRVGRMVLDAVVDPAITNEELILGQTKGFELALTAFIEDCLANKPCELGKSNGEVRSRISALLKRADSRPLETRSGRDLNEALATYGVLTGLYAQFLWPTLRTGLAAAYDGDGSELLALADRLVDRAPDGSYTNNGAEAIYAVNCLDHPGGSSLADIRRMLPTLVEISPIFGSFIGWGALPCDYWPVPSDRQPAPVAAPGAPPILVLGTTNDPATPYEWSVNLAEQLESGVLLTREGDGHAAHGTGNRCIDKAVDKYLLSGATPKAGTRC